MNITKSQFLKGSVASAFAIGSVASASAKALTPDTKWDDEADVVVIGFGGAAHPAAITAHDAGSNVLIIEKNGRSRRKHRSFCRRLYDS